MTQFLLCILQYVIIMVILAVIGFAGGKIGVALRKKKDAKAAAEAANTEE